MVLEPIADQLHIRKAIHELASKISLEEPVFIATIRYCDRRGVVILADENITAAVLIELVIRLRQFFK